MNINKIIALLLALAMCLSMAACGKKDKEETAEDTTEVEEVAEEMEEPAEEETSEEEEPAEETEEEAAEEEEEKPQSFDVILYGHALENVNVRSGAGKDFEKLDKVEAGSIVEIYEKTDKIDGYNWYRIGEDMWVADDGTWFEFCDSEIYVDGYFGVNPWNFTEELRAEWVLDQVRNQADIKPSTADSTFEWFVDKADPNFAPGVDYYVYYQGGYYGMVYETECAISKAGDLTINVTVDDRSNYDPTVNYDWTVGQDEPYVQTVYEGEYLAVLNAVKEHCEWYDPWFAGRYPNGLTQGSNCDWSLNYEGDGVWTGDLYTADLMGAASIYNFRVTTVDGAYSVEDVDGPYL